MSQEAVDAAALAFRFGVGFIFLAAAIPKLIHPREFGRSLASYNLLPHRLVRPAARAVPLLELLCAVALLLGIAPAPLAFIAAALLVTFAAGMATNLLRGREIDCGCSISTARRAISWELVIADLSLAVLAVAVGEANSDVLALAPLTEKASTLPDTDGVAMLIVAVAGVLVVLLASGARAALWTVKKAPSR